MIYLVCCKLVSQHEQESLFRVSFCSHDSFIGGLYGRLIGNVIVDLHGGVPSHNFWKWIDPGALALIGAASFFGGVSRLTVSLTVIMVSFSVRYF